jgi:hypothetical protein
MFFPILILVLVPPVGEVIRVTEANLVTRAMATLLMAVPVIVDDGESLIRLHSA